MTQNNQNDNQASEADALFAGMRQINPIREDVVDDEDLDDEDGGGDGGDSLDERMESSRKLSDIQTIVLRLHPDLGVKYLNVQQVARIFPDSYNPLFNMQVKDLMRRKGMSMTEAATYVNTSLSIAIDGEGRLDDIQVGKGGGVSSDEDKSKGLVS